MDITGLIIDRNTGEIVDDATRTDYDNFDGCFRLTCDDCVITDGSGFLKTYYSMAKRKLVSDLNGYDFYNDSLISLPENAIFDIKSCTASYFHVPRKIDDIFEYFEKYFANAVRSMIDKRMKICLSMSMGLDSRYLYAILLKNGLSCDLVSHGKEAVLCEKFFPGLHILNDDCRKKYLSEYMKYYRFRKQRSWVIEYHVYAFYGEVIAYGYDVIIDGLGRNFLCTHPHTIDSFHSFQAQNLFMYGREPYINAKRIKTLFPYTLKDIRFNLRMLNVNEVEMCKKIQERIKFLCPELADIETPSFKKAAKNDYDALQMNFRVR